MFYRIPKFNYFKAGSIDEALELLNKLDDVKVLAGGTDLVMDLKIGRYRPKNIVDISGVKELRYIKDEGEAVRIGALTRLQEILESPVIKQKLPALYEAVYKMASWQVRNVGTIGGNLCNASPAADTAPPLMVYEAKLKIVGAGKEKQIPINQFFKGPRHTALEKGELLAEIIVPYSEKAGSSTIKLGRRNAFTLSIVAVSTYVVVEDNTFKDVRIALNAVAPTPVRASIAERYLIGREVSVRNVMAAGELVRRNISPISDVRASAEYRREMSVVLTRDSLIRSLKKVGVDLGGD